ncbi:uncharacterized protein J3D65DRAFT_692195 [Phyllosticta citribraziliensis]|uniref:Uncharacterized protein n=1 Tax=Phyllosticta citribraziliensis TaxID=989973 RepID=A0ABR1M270_9PEZI
MVNQEELAAIRHLFGDHEAQLWSEGRGHMFVRDNEGEIHNVRGEMFDELRRVAAVQQQQQQQQQQRQRQHQQPQENYDADVESNEDSFSESDSDLSASSYSSSEDGSGIWDEEVLLPPFTNADIERFAGHQIHTMLVEGPLSPQQVAIVHRLFGELAAQLWLAGRRSMMVRTPEGEYCMVIRGDLRRRQQQQQRDMLEHFQQQRQQQLQQQQLQQQQRQQRQQRRRSPSPVELAAVEQPVEVEAVQRPVEMPAREQPLSTAQLLFIAQEFGDEEAHRWFEGRGSRYARNRDGEVVLIRSALFETFQLQ